MVLLSPDARTQPAETPPDETSIEEPEGEIGGIVVSAKTGEPLKGAEVTLRGGGSRRAGRSGRRSGQNQTSSGFDGRFLFSHLAEGEYALMAGKAGYETRRSFRELARVKLARNQSRKNIEICLRPSAVVTGKLTNSLGEPLPGAFVSAYRRSYDEAGNATWGGGELAISNDLGEYRLYGLPEGSYVLGVSPPNEPSPPAIRYADYLPLYYPGVATAEEATPLKLRWGSEQTGVDLSLPPAPRTAVRGVVMDTETGACASCRVHLSDRSVYSVMTQTNSQGQFGFYGVPTGPHILLATPDGRRRREPLMARVDVVVSESGGEELVLELAPGQTVSGTIVEEDPPQTNTQDQAQAGAQGPAGNRGNRRRRITVVLSN